MTRKVRRYRVWHAAGMSDEPSRMYLLVEGPHGNRFATCAALAEMAEDALNTPTRLSSLARAVIREALAERLAGEHPWNDVEAACAAHLLEQL